MPSPRRLLALPLAIAPLGVIGWLWLALLSPWTYDRPDHLAPIQNGPHRLFVYGTLRHAPVRWLVYGRTGDPEQVVLPGFRRERLNLVPDGDARVEGWLLCLNAEELSRLDRYERLGYRYERIRVTLADGREVWAYRRLTK